MLKRLIGTGLAAAALAVAGCSDDDEDGGAGAAPADRGSAAAGETPAPAGPTGTAPAEAPVPAREVTDLAKAAKAAGCRVQEFADEGSDHVEEELTAADYRTNPPTSGNHNPIAAPDGHYPESATPALKYTVHALEHGRIQIQYRPDIAERRKAQLRAVFNEDIVGAGSAYHMQMFATNSDMEPPVAAVAWRSSLTCPSVRDTTFDAIRAFYEKYVDEGPEQVP